MNIDDVLSIGRVFSAVEGIVQLIAIAVSIFDDELHSSVVWVDASTFISAATAVHSVLLNSQASRGNLGTIENTNLIYEGRGRSVSVEQSLPLLRSHLPKTNPWFYIFFVVIQHLNMH